MLIDDIALTMHPEAGCRTVVHLLEQFGSAENVYAASEDELRQGAGLKASVARSILRRESHPKAAAELEFITRSRLKVLTSDSPQYPRRLLECEDYPHVLYVSGSIDFNAGRWLSVVGTRKITAYGNRMCEVLIGQLAEQVPDLVIVSGLAYGVDVAAHRAAMNHGVPTVGILGHPVNRIYPPPNTDTARRMVTQGGAVLSEFPSCEEPLRSGFVQRNRIIAGLSDGTLVVESAARGGSLITADMADGYHRTLMAVPGRVGDLYSEGPNRLIRSLKAQMVCSGPEIAELMNWDCADPAASATQPELFDTAGTSGEPDATSGQAADRRQQPDTPSPKPVEDPPAASEAGISKIQIQSKDFSPQETPDEDQGSFPTNTQPETRQSSAAMDIRPRSTEALQNGEEEPDTERRNEEIDHPNEIKPGARTGGGQPYPRAYAAGPPTDEALSPAAQRLLEMIGTDEAVSMDELSLKAPFPAADLSLLLLDLEFSGRICSLPGNRYLKY